MHYHLKNLEIQAFIGVYESEKKSRQKILVSVEFDFDSAEAGKTDDLNDTIDYSSLEKFVRETCEAKHFQLLEHLHFILDQSIVNWFPKVENVKVSIEKFPFQTGSIVIK